MLLVKMQGGPIVLGQKEGFSLGLGGLILLNRLLHGWGALTFVTVLRPYDPNSCISISVQLF